jgi:hypothetical protein
MRLSAAPMPAIGPKGESPMSSLLEDERGRQAALKRASRALSEAARTDGQYKGKPRPFCLPRDCAAENLFAGIRQPAIRYFRSHEIHWHDGHGGEPSNHLCGSQVCCVNFLFPFADEPEALAALLRPVFPQLRRVLPFAAEGQYLAFEWIGERNYLCERVPKGGRRTRGANFTSADAAVQFERVDGKVQTVLIEWKYTESYSGASLVRSKSGTDRTGIYTRLYERDDFPLDKSALSSFGALFVEPFYQLLRQQCLANGMERAREHGADVVSVLHIAPLCNRDFARVTSAELAGLGPGVIAVWKRLVQREDRFASAATEDLFGQFPVGRFAKLQDWWDYVTVRYAWIRPTGGMQ